MRNADLRATDRGPGSDESEREAPCSHGPLSERCVCVLASRCLVVCIVMARHGVLVLIDGARTLAMAAKRPEPDDVQDITQLFVFLAVPAALV